MTDLQKKTQHVPVHITNYSKTFDRFKAGQDRDLAEQVFKFMNYQFDGFGDGAPWFSGESDDGYGKIQPACPDDFRSPVDAKAYASKPFNAWCCLNTEFYKQGALVTQDIYDYLVKKMEKKAADLVKIINKAFESDSTFKSFRAEVVNKTFDLKLFAAGPVCPLFLKITHF